MRCAVRSTNRKLPVLNVKKITFLQNVATSTVAAAAWPDPRYVLVLIRVGCEFRDRKPVAFVVVLLLDVRRTWPDEHGPPKCLREVHAQTQDIGMWQRIHQSVDQ